MGWGAEYIALLLALVLSSASYGGNECKPGKLVPAHERFGDLLTFLVRDKAKIGDDVLEFIATSDSPVNPVLLDPTAFGNIDAHTFGTTFAAFMNEGIAPGEWIGLRALAQSLRHVRTDTAEKREAASRDTRWVFSPVVLRKETVMERTDRLLGARVDTDGKIVFSYQKFSDGKTRVVTIDPVTSRATIGKDLDTATRASGGLPFGSKAAGLLRMPNGERLTVAIRQGWRNGAFTTYVDFIDAANGNYVKSVDLKQQFVPESALHAYVRPDGTPAFVIQSSEGAEPFGLRTPPAWHYDVEGKWEKLGRHAQYIGSPETQRLFSVDLRKRAFNPLAPFRQRPFSLEIADVGTKKRILSVDLGATGRYSTTKTQIKEKPDGSLLVATRVGDRIFVFDTGADKKYEIKSPAGAKADFAGFFETNRGWIFLAEPEGDALHGVSLGDGKALRAPLGKDVRRNTVIIKNKDGGVVMVSDLPNKKAVETLDLATGGMNETPFPVADGTPLATYRAPDGRLVRPYLKDGVLYHVQLEGPLGNVP